MAECGMRLRSVQRDLVSRYTGRRISCASAGYPPPDMRAYMCHPVQFECRPAPQSNAREDREQGVLRRWERTDAPEVEPPIEGKGRVNRRVRNV